ncbi:hypothetical protein NEMBOFW57_000005 [Staphylotrichum longicolle]|uniref:Uncharacterized protein n=1 Tax=Staphylotrichum longicolle TaxID=669026 RepID=A0AAD4I2J7_9PEZI|nr:hypothetical protein NEMBOFW57_000005 [Staphylotrichum longicolle]
MRIILILSALIISDDGYSIPMPCAKVSYLMGSEAKTLAAYPDCESYFSHQDANKAVLVPASMNGNGSNAAAALSLGFGAAFWLAFTMHAIGVEVYLHLTPAEADRLRNVSYQRQLEAGMKHPGRAGLTTDRLGDSSLWTPQDRREQGKDSEAEK